MATILSIETGTDICSVGLSIDGVLIAIRESSGDRDHATNIAVFINDLLKENSITVCSLDAVAVSAGPGSYTGLRIGVSVAKGICYANNLPLIAINSLQSLVECAIEDNEISIVDFSKAANTLLLPMIDARRMEVYTQRYTALGVPVDEVEAKIVDETSYSELKDNNIVLFGSGAKKCYDVIGNDKKIFIEITPSARGLVRIAHKKFINKEFESLAYYEPMYLKDFIGVKSTKNYLK